MDWEKLDWTILDRLRDGFLSGTAANGPYWRSLEDLAQYDSTFGERIGWKWDAVLAELIRRGWTPIGHNVGRPLTVLDWGCGSGIAARRVIAAFGPDKFSQLLVWDHSAMARQFASEAAKKLFPNLSVTDFRDGAEFDVLVVSHVLNELSPESRAELLAVAKQASAVIWVEPGTHVVSRGLIAIREELRTDLRVVAPCTHSERCGLLTDANAPHWCHYFAAPPPALYADSDWVKFGQRAGIDLRSLPYSFLVLQSGPVAPADPEVARIVGEPRHFKGFAKLLSCSVSGVDDLMLQKRDDPALFKSLKRESNVPIYRWKREGDRIKEAVRLYPPDQHNAEQT